MRHRLAAVLLLLAGVVSVVAAFRPGSAGAIPPAQAAKQKPSCGEARWSVKTGTDPDAASVNLTPTPTTIANLVARPRPSSPPPNNRVAPVETAVYAVTATLTWDHLMPDGDYHLVLQDPNGKTLISEVPNPRCVGAASPFLTRITNARAQVDANLTVTTSLRPASVPVMVTGVGFWDGDLTATGASMTGIELHPILDVIFNPPTPAPPTPTSTPTSPPTPPRAPDLDVAARATDGYRMVASDGGIFSFGNAIFAGSQGGKPLNKPIVGVASTSDGGGYWMVASDGGIFAFGSALFAGSQGGKPLNKPIVGMSATPDGGGYWMVASDGGIFTFGDAVFYGSEGGKPLNKPIVGMAATPDGGGYWLVASDGGIFSFGDARFFGSEGGRPLNRPIVAAAAAQDGLGYWMVASDGGIFAFGSAAFYGSKGGTSLNRPIAGMAPTESGRGYWLVASDGGIFAFGDAPFQGSQGGKPLNAAVVGFAAG